MLPQMPGGWQDFTTTKWQPLLRNLHQMVLADAHLDHRNNFAAAGGTSHWRDCHCADALSSSLLKHLLKAEGGAAEWQSRRRLGGTTVANQSVSSVVSLRGVEGAGSAAEEPARLAQTIFSHGGGGSQAEAADRQVRLRAGPHPAKYPPPLLSSAAERHVAVLAGRCHAHARELRCRAGPVADAADWEVTEDPQ